MLKILNENERKMARIATLAVAARKNHANRITVFLGAGASIASGVPTWKGVCDQLVKKLHLSYSSESDSIDLVRKFFHNGPADSYERFWALYPSLSSYEPSPGYSHLANLVSQGFATCAVSKSSFI